jgi:hypothetical protein
VRLPFLEVGATLLPSGATGLGSRRLCSQFVTSRPSRYGNDLQTRVFEFPDNPCVLRPESLFSTLGSTTGRDSRYPPAANRIWSLSFLIIRAPVMRVSRGDRPMARIVGFDGNRSWLRSKNVSSFPPNHADEEMERFRRVVKGVRLTPSEDSRFSFLPREGHQKGSGVSLRISSDEDTPDSRPP